MHSDTFTIVMMLMLTYFQYIVSDGISTSLEDSVIIFILNEAPFGEPDFYSVQNGETLNIDELSGALSNDLDSNSCDVLRVKLIQPPSYHLGSFTLDTTGAFTYIHDGSLTPTRTILFINFLMEKIMQLRQILFL